MDKDLFLSLCEKYDVELSTSAVSPMIKDEEQIHAITADDVNDILGNFHKENYKGKDVIPSGDNGKEFEL